ncbi:MAG: hypothetical protein NC548_41930 [Lachnospiraceae bacterium]|nr:hypothetical protein [Lachnospiraceae bacterium]
MEVYADGTKKYVMQREQKQDKKVVLYQTGRDDGHDEIRVFLLFSDKDRRYVNKMQRELANKKIDLIKGLAEAEMLYGENKDIINTYDYVVVIVSKDFLEELDLLDILEANYKCKEENEKILPIIIWKDLYEPEGKDEIVKDLKKRIDGYQESHPEILSDLDGNVAKELGRMQRILTMIEDFIYFAARRDKKVNLQGSNKLLKYIRYESNIEVADREISVGSKDGIINQTINAAQVNIANDHATINANMGGGR